MSTSNTIKFFILAFVSIFLHPKDLLADSYFIQIHHKTQSVSVGKIFPKNIRKFKREFWLNEVDSTQFGEISKALKEHISIPKASKQLIHIHGMWGSKPLFMAENVVNFNRDYAENDSLNYEHIFYIMWDANHNKYRKNIRNAEVDAPLLNKVLIHLQNAFSDTKFTIQTHSMGGYILTQSIRLNHFENSPFDQLLLHAPDFSQNELEDVQNQLVRLFNNIHIFYHRKDWPLKISTRKNKAKRIGRDPEIRPHKNIEWIDCTKMKAKGLPAKISKHLHYRSSPETIEEILERMAR